MSPRHDLAVIFRLVGKKVLAQRINYFVVGGLLALFGFFWKQVDFGFALRLYLLVFPYLFLVLSQDMVRDEVESGMLENVVFLGGGFRGYLLVKNFVLWGIAFLGSFFIFAVVGGYALATRQLEGYHGLQFVVGVVVGFYYVCVGGLLSHYLRAGSNVLAVVLGQVLVFVGLFFMVTQRGGFIDYLTEGRFPTLAAKAEFVGLIVFIPNIVGIRKYLVGGIMVAGLAVAFLGWQWIKIRRLELRKG